MKPLYAHEYKTIMDKQIKLQSDIGTAKKGSIYIQGLHGIPDSCKDTNTNKEDWYWLKDSKKEEYHFLYKGSFSSPPPERKIMSKKT